MKIQLLACFLPALLVSCASVNSYHEPQTGSQPLATVYTGSSTRAGLFEWRSSVVSSIDNMQIGMVWSDNSKVNVVPGPHLFVINSEFNLGFGSGGPFSSMTEIHATLKPGITYRFVGKANGAHMNVWAVDNRGQRVSEIGSSGYQTSPQQTTFVTVVH